MDAISDGSWFQAPSAGIQTRRGLCKKEVQGAGREEKFFLCGNIIRSR